MPFRVTKTHAEFNQLIVEIAKLIASGMFKPEIKAELRKRYPDVSSRQIEAWHSRARDWLRKGDGMVHQDEIRAMLDEHCRSIMKQSPRDVDRVRAMELWAKVAGIIQTGGINVNVGTQVQVGNGKHAAAQVNWKALAQLQDATLKASAGSATIELQAVTPDPLALPPVPDKPIDCVDVPTISSVVPQEQVAPTPQVAQVPDTKPQAQ